MKPTPASLEKACRGAVVGPFQACLYGIGLPLNALVLHQHRLADDIDNVHRCVLPFGIAEVQFFPERKLNGLLEAAVNGDVVGI